MRKTKLLLPVLFLLAANITSHAQEEQSGSPHNIAAKVLFLDYATPNGLGLDTLPFSNGIEVAYIRNFNPYLNIAFPVKVGLANVEGFMNGRTVVCVDAILQAQYQKTPKSFLTPYIFGGGSVVYENFEMASLQFPVGLGLNLRLAPNTFLNLQGEYRHSLADNRNNLIYGAGLVFRLVPAVKLPEPPPLPPPPPPIEDRDGDGVPDDKDECPDEAGLPALLGCPDRDGDGVPDHLDDCPDEPGPASTAGCPDADGDGVADKDDDCPDEPGLKSNKGCPEVEEVVVIADRDGDGIPDDEDDCPDKPGLVSMRGCPDADGDGIPDHLDDCPNLAGPASTRGCPDRDGDGVPDKDDKCPDVPGTLDGCPDSDGDGVPDHLDDCPDVAGPASNSGCPELKKEEVEYIAFATQAVNFETGKALLMSDSYLILDKVAEILDQYPHYKVRIIGHTDNTGSSTFNMALSKERAKSCYEYFLSRGLPAERLSFDGKGPNQPIATNATTEGRELNRRVEFELYIK